MQVLDHTVEIKYVMSDVLPIVSQFTSKSIAPNLVCFIAKVIKQLPAHIDFNATWLSIENERENVPRLQIHNPPTVFRLTLQPLENSHVQIGTFVIRVYARINMAGEDFVVAGI